MCVLSEKLKLLPRNQYRGVDEHDPVRYYYYPVFGQMYRRRVELCIAECQNGERILEVGFGAGVTFLNLEQKYNEIHGLDLTADINIVLDVFKPYNINLFLKNGNVLNMPYENDKFDTVLLISILEHLKPEEQQTAFSEIKRVLKPEGEVIYGVPIERPFMVMMFKILGYDIRKAHFSTEQDVLHAAEGLLEKVRIIDMKSIPSVFGTVYQVGHFTKAL